MVTVSPAGRFLSGWDVGGNLALRDAVTGGDRALTHFGEKDGVDPRDAVFSPDSRRVAYLENGTTLVLRVLSLDGGGSAKSEVLYRPSDDVRWFTPYAWSSDGQWISVYLDKKDNTKQIGLVQVSNGSLRVLKTTDWSARPGALRFSPDGRYLLFDLSAGSNGRDRHVFALALDGSREIPVVADAGYSNGVVGWTQDDHILFVSDRGGSTGLWAVAWNGGRPGTPALIEPNMNLERTIGLTHGGGLYYVAQVTGRDVCVASIDARSGEVLSPPVPLIRRFVVVDAWPAWSVDGKFLAHIAKRDIRSAGGEFISIRSMTSGETRELHPEIPLSFSGVSHLRWSPDGQSFAVVSYNDKGRYVVYSINAKTGATNALTSGSDAQQPTAIAGWAPDGQAVFYETFTSAGVEAGEAVSRLVRRDMRSGAVTELARGVRNAFSNPVLSPDGRTIAYETYPTAGSTSKLMIMPSSGGQPRELRASDHNMFNKYAPVWTRDSQAILVSKRTAPPASEQQMWLLPVNGGSPKQVSLGVPEVLEWTLNPATDELAFVSGWGKSEVRVLENFLPRVAAVK